MPAKPLTLLLARGAALMAIAATLPPAPASADRPATLAAAPTTPPVTTPAAPPAAAAVGAWGIDLSGGDPAVRPGDDFEHYASGLWLAARNIPADRASVGTSSDLRETVQAQVRDLITAAPPTSRIGALYASFMDETGIEAVGLAPLKADLAKIAALPDKAALARFMGGTNGVFGISVVDFGLIPDTANAEVNLLGLSQGGLGLPNRSYYLDAQFAPQRAAYHAYIVRTLEKTGLAADDDAAAAGADAIIGFETAIAKVSWSNEDRRDINRMNNLYSSQSFAVFAPGIDWTAFFAGAHVPPQKRLLAGENTAIRDIAQLYGEAPLATLKLWEQFHVADQASHYLGKDMVESNFAFERTLSGVSEDRPRWKRGVDLVNNALGEPVGRVYVAKYFPPAAKAQMEVLVANLKIAMADRIIGNGWMATATKEAALTKLGRMRVMVGYPDKWRDFSGLKIEPGDLYGNVQRAGAFNAAYEMADLGKPVDHAKWGMTPQTVNAYNGFLENKIVFPAGILQPPYFDPNADAAVNYGAIGAIIGHEISHGFDDQGRKVDAAGNVHDWWTPADASRFEAEASVFGAEYAAFEPLPGAHLNPGQTMGENIADLAGLQAALAAYHASLGGKPAPVLDGLSGDQRFFLAYAQAWRSKVREDALRRQVAVDPHSPARFRILGPLPNIDAWYAAFNVKPGDAMYIAPEKRARIW